MSNREILGGGFLFPTDSGCIPFALKRCNKMAESILDLVGNTPLVRISRLNTNPRVPIYAKLESFNPGGSVKDRVALSMIEDAESRGEITPEKTIIEPTSGNTGIGLAMVCAVKGYRLLLIMPESVSEERRRILKAYGAELFLTPGHLSTDGAIEEAYRLAREEPERYLLVDQFNNPANVKAHYEHTALEIWEQTGGQVTHVVGSMGTSGSVMGISSRMREYSAGVKTVAVEPYAGHAIQGLKNMQASYPPGIYDKKVLDRIIHVEDEHAYELCRQLARKEGILAGMSSGAALGGALHLASELEQGMIVVILPDTGERYLSTPLFASPLKQGMRIYNLARQEKTYLDLQSGPSGVFTPGPSSEEIGDLETWRRMVFLDVLQRYLCTRDLDCSVYVGLADQDDQALHQARQQGQSLQVHSRKYEERVRVLAESLQIKDIVLCPASHKQEFMISLCQRLLDKGRGYEKLRSVYFDVSRDPEYGGLAHTDLSQLSLGKTVDLEDYAKENPQDFTLLKRASLQDLKLGEFLKTKWGNVRPSWYLQMAAAPGEAIDSLHMIQAGGSHQFPHLENLRAIWSQAELGKPQVWSVVQGVEVPEEDLVPNLEGLLSEDHQLILRMWLLSNAYRKPLVLSRENLDMWRHNWRRVQNLAANMHQLQEEDEGGEVSREVEQAVFEVRSNFADAIEDDLSLYRFWPVLFDLCKRINSRYSRRELNAAEAGWVLKRLKEMDSVLRVVDWSRMPLKTSQISGDIADLVQERARAKRERDFPRADELRERIREQGFRLEDSPYGPRLFPEK